MKTKPNISRRLHQSVLALSMLAILSGQTFAQAAAKTAPPAAAVSLSQAEKQLSDAIKLETIKEVTTALSAPDMQGRGTMQPGGEKAAQYIADRFKKLGLKPLGDNGTYLQKVNFTERSFTPETSFKVGDESFKMGTDYAVMPLYNGDENASGEMVFIAYGIPGESKMRDDLAGVDMRGKIAVMLEGPPANFDKETWEENQFSMKAVFNLVRAGAAGIVFVNHGREEQKFDDVAMYFSRRQISLPGGESNYPEFLPPFIQVSNATAEKLFAKSGVTFKDALAAAERNDFKPIELKQNAGIIAKYKNTEGTSPNVVAVLEGSDPALKAEAVLFSAHYDAYGTEDGKFYPGAADNALGVAEMFSVAEAFAKSERKPKRSLIFLAVTAEEYGLYGSKHWSKNPTWDIKKVAANLNLDGVGTEVYGPVTEMVGYGAEHSTLGAMLNEVAGAMKIKVISDPFPEEKVFYRSDHYSFVERGVPSLMLLGENGGDWIKRMKDWEKTDYHNTGDVIRPTWHWEGAKTVADVMGIMGLRLANAEKMPEWLKSSRFGNLERGNTQELPEEN